MKPAVRLVLDVLGKILVGGLLVGLVLLSIPAITAAGMVVVAIYPLIIGLLVAVLVFSFIFRSKELPQYSWLGQLLYILWFPAFVVGVTAPIRALGVAGYSVPSMAWFDVAVGASGILVTVLLTTLDVAWRRGQLEQLESLPTSKVRSAAIGLAEFRGKVAPDAVPQDRIPPGKGRGPKPFYLEDATGRILVDPRGAQVRPGWAGSFSGRTCEALIPWGGLSAGHDVYVIGSVQRNPAAAPDAAGPDALVVAPLDEPVAAGFFRRLLLQRRDRAPQSQRDIQHVFFLSDGTEDKARRRLWAGLGQILAIAAIWIASSVWMVATQLPKTRGIAHWSLREVIDFGNGERTGELLRRLRTDGPSDRAKILDAFVDDDLVTHEAFVAVAAGLSDPSPALRAAASGCVRRLDEQKWRIDLPSQHWPTVLAAVGSGLAHPDPTFRIAALRISGMALNAPELVPLLLRAVDDPTDEVRQVALFALQKMGPKAAAAVPAIVRRLEDDKVEVRDAAFGALPAMFAGTDGRPLFRQLLRHAKPTIRRFALEGLAAPAPQGDDVVGELMAALNDPEAEVRAQAADGLGRYDAAAAAAECSLLALLSDPYTSVQGSAARALARVAPEPASHIDAFAMLFGSDSWWVRRVACDALINLGTLADRAVPAALVWLEGGSQPVQSEILRLLEESWRKRGAGCVGPVGALAVPPLITLLQGTSGYPLKNRAISVLSLLGEDAAPALPAILALRGDSSNRSSVLGALQRLGPAAEAAAPAIVDDLFARNAGEAAETLVRIVPRDRALIARLIEGLKSPKPDVSGACVRILAACGSDAADAAPALAEILRWRYDGTAMDALVSIGAASVAPLIESLDHADEQVRSRAAEVLGRIGPAAHPASAALARRLTDPQFGPRRKATDAIARINPSTALEALVPLLKQSDAMLKRDAIEGIERLGPAAAPALPALIEALRDRVTEAGAAQILGKLGEVARPALPALIEANRRMNSIASGIAILRILNIPVLQDSFENTIRRHLLFLDPSDEEALLIGTELLRHQLPGVIDALMPRVAYGKGTGPRARSLLLQGLKHPSAGIVICAMDGLVRIGPDPEIVSALREHLRRTPPALELETVRALRALGPQAAPALPELTTRVKAQGDSLASETVATIGRLGPLALEARGVLEIAAAKGGPLLRDAAAVALQRISAPPSETLDLLWRTGPRSPAAADLYRELGSHADPVVRETAVLAWAWRRREPQELAELIVALGDPHPSVRAAAAEVLVERGGAEPFLIPLLRDPSTRLRRLAAEGVKPSTAAAAEAVPALLDLLRDPDRGVRRTAAAALASAGPEARDGVADLVRVAKEGDDDAIAALGAIGPDAASAVPFLIEEARRNLWRTVVIEALGKIGAAAREAVPILTAGLSHQGQNVRWDCAEALGGIGPDAAPAVPALLEAGRNIRDDRLLTTVSRALARIGPVALPALIEAFKQANPAAAGAITGMGPAAADAVPMLREALRGDNVVQQFMAIRALRGIGPPAAAAIPELRRFLSATTNIRYEASRTLASIQGGKR